MQRPAHLLARSLVAAFFLYEGVDKIVRFHEWRARLSEAGLPMPDAFMAGTLLLLWAGGFMLLVGYKARLGAFLLLMFQVPVTGWFEFTTQDPTGALKSVALIGGLLLLTVHTTPAAKSG